MTFSNRWNRFIYALWAPIYDAFIRFHPASRARARAFDLVDICNGSKVLLVGVGTGADLDFLKSSSLIIGVDLSPPMLRRARRRARHRTLSFVPVCCDAASLPLGDLTFDTVVLTLIVSVVPDPRTCVEQAMRVVRSGGRILVLDKFVPQGAAPSFPRRVLNLLTRTFGTDINRHWEKISDGLGTTVVDEAVGWNGSLRVIVIEK